MKSSRRDTLCFHSSVWRKVQKCMNFKLQLKVKPGTLKHNNKILKFKKTYFMETISMPKDEFFAIVVLLI